MNQPLVSAVKKIETGIAGFDAISNGGLPAGRTTLVTGTSGSSKTVFAVQFLIEGIRRWNENSVFVTFEETPDDIRRNMLSFGWNIEKLEADNRWAFVDASPKPDEVAVISGEFDLHALLARVSHAIKKVNATRISIDSLGTIFNKFDDVRTVRNELLRITGALKALGVTVVVTAERADEYGDVARYGIEEFVVDNVVILRNVLDAESRRRTMEILKFRGTHHQKGEFPFTVVHNSGVVCNPLSAADLNHNSSHVRVSSGSEKLNSMCGGGFFRDSIVLISGATGTGKTLMATSFIAGAAENDRGLFFAFEESREQLFRNASGWGVDFLAMENDGRLKVVCAYPETQGLNEHLISMQRAIDEYKPTRVAIDSLSALERGASAKAYREFVIGLTSFLKEREIVCVLTSVTPSLMSSSSVTEAHISTITDSIVLLRYVELFGEISRGIAVLKMRGSAHDKEIREFSIDDTGMAIGLPFRNITGILSGNPQFHQHPENHRLQQMFKEE